MDFLTGIIPSSSSSASVSPVGFLVGFFLGLGAGTSESEEKEVVTDLDLEGRESGIWKGFFLMGCLRSETSSLEMVPDWNFLGLNASGTLNVLFVGLPRRSASGSFSGTALVLPFDFRGGGTSMAFFGTFV